MILGSRATCVTIYIGSITDCTQLALVLHHHASLHVGCVLITNKLPANINLFLNYILIVNVVAVHKQRLRGLMEHCSSSHAVCLNPDIDVVE